MPEFSDALMMERLKEAKTYTACILRNTPRLKEPGAEKIVWEHGRRNMKLNSEGILAVVCPINDGSEFSGLGVFTTSLEETRRILDDDPGIRAGIFTYELHVCRGFPGNALP